MPKHSRLFELFYTPRFPPFFVLGAVLLSVMGNTLTDLIKSLVGSTPWRVFFIFMGAGLAITVLVLTAYAVGAIQKRLTDQLPTRIEGKINPAPCKGLIAFVSLRQREHLLKAIKYHDGTLEQVWLIATRDTAHLAEEIKQDYKTEKLSISIIPLDDPLELNKSKEVVEKIYREYLGTLAEEDVIADFTGGTKPMTVGMIFACLGLSRKLEYVPAIYEDNGPITALDPIAYVLDATTARTMKGSEV